MTKWQRYRARPGVELPEPWQEVADAGELILNGRHYHQLVPTAALDEITPLDSHKVLPQWPTPVELRDHLYEPVPASVPNRFTSDPERKQIELLRSTTHATISTERGGVVLATASVTDISTTDRDLVVTLQVDGWHHSEERQGEWLEFWHGSEQTYAMRWPVVRGTGTMHLTHPLTGFLIRDA